MHRSERQACWERRADLVARLSVRAPVLHWLWFALWRWLLWQSTLE
jgi:hypothetical protein